jgi:hypothetical protein
MYNSNQLINDQKACKKSYNAYIIVQLLQNHMNSSLHECRGEKGRSGRELRPSRGRTGHTAMAVAL